MLKKGEQRICLLLIVHANAPASPEEIVCTMKVQSCILHFFLCYQHVFLYYK